MKAGKNSSVTCYEQENKLETYGKEQCYDFVCVFGEIVLSFNGYLLERPSISRILE